MLNIEFLIFASKKIGAALIQNENFIPLKGYQKFSNEECFSKSEKFFNTVKLRRTVREFSSEPVLKETIENCIKSAGSAPSGANMQPWHFCAVSDLGLKKKIRIAAEKEEKEFYGGKAPQEWLDVLQKFETNPEKPFLEDAPWLIMIFEKKYDLDIDGKKIKHYYTKESVGIASGMLITALHFSGLVTLTHTPSPMNFLNDILDRPSNEKPFLVLVFGYPKENVMVPNIKRKPIPEIASFM